jgi:hypothetical protein
MFWYYEPNQKVCGQVVIEDADPSEIEPRPNPSRVEVLHRFQWESHIKITFLVGTFDAAGYSLDKIREVCLELADSPLEKVTSDPIVTWDYNQMIEEYNISFVVCRDYRVFPKFYGDPKFRLVFKGGNVAIFQVVK